MPPGPPVPIVSHFLAWTLCLGVFVCRLLITSRPPLSPVTNAPPAYSSLSPPLILIKFIQIHLDINSYVLKAMSTKYHELTPGGVWRAKRPGKAGAGRGDITYSRARPCLYCLALHLAKRRGSSWSRVSLGNARRLICWKAPMSGGACRQTQARGALSCLHLPPAARCPRACRPLACCRAKKHLPSARSWNCLDSKWARTGTGRQGHGRQRRAALRASATRQTQCCCPRDAPRAPAASASLSLWWARAGRGAKSCVSDARARAGAARRELGSHARRALDS